MHKAKVFILDMEGVLVKGPNLSPIGNAVKFIDELNKLVVPYMIATNNSTLSPEEIHKRLIDNGFFS